MDGARVALQRRTVRVLIGSQILGGAGFFLGFAVSVLLAKDITGSDSLVGIPVAVAVAMAAAAAGPIGSWMQRVGRRPGLALGYAVGTVGCVAVVLAADASSFVALCAGMGLFGVANTSNLMSRYAASDLAPEDARGRAISAILLATAGGAILGPNLAELAGELGDPLGVPERAAPFAVSAALLAAASVVVMTALRPDPLLEARRLDEPPPEEDPEAVAAPAAAGLAADPGADSGGGPGRPRIWTGLALAGAAALVLSNLTMVSIMTMTPVHLDDAGQSLGTVGLVISLHVAGMFLPSPVTGRLVDRVGRLQMMAAGGLILVAAAAVAATTSGHHAGPVIVALVLLGIGWNVGLVGGSALLTDSVPLRHRASAQGRADLAMGAAGAMGSLASGAVIALGGFALLGAVGAMAGAVLVLVAVRSGMRPPDPAPA